MIIELQLEIRKIEKECILKDKKQKARLDNKNLTKIKKCHFTQVIVNKNIN